MNMFNIISFSSESFDFAKAGYERLYELDKVKNKIANVKNLTEATNYKNKKTLVMLQEFDLEEGAIKIIAEKKKACFLIDFSKIINTYGVTRAILLSKLRTFLKFCNKFGAYYAFADFAKNEFELRSGRELMHISLLLGLNLGQAKFAIKMMKHYLD